GIATRAQSGARHHLGDSFAGLLGHRRARRAPLIRRALAIGAAAAECRTLGENLGVILAVATRTVTANLGARMLLPAAALRAIFARRIEFRAVAARFARTIKPRTIALRTILAWSREARTLRA